MTAGPRKQRKPLPVMAVKNQYKNPIYLSLQAPNYRIPRQSKYKTELPNLYVYFCTELKT